MFSKEEDFAELSDSMVPRVSQEEFSHDLSMQLVNHQAQASKSLQQPQPRKYKLGLTEQQKSKLGIYRERYEKFLKLHNNTSTKEVWQIYDHIATELLREQLNLALHSYVTHDLDKFIEQVLVDEFQL